MQGPKYKIGDTHYTAAYRRPKDQPTEIFIMKEEVQGIIKHPKGHWVYIIYDSAIGEDYPIHTDIGKTEKCDDEYCKYLRVDTWVHENNFCDSEIECRKKAEEREVTLGPRIKNMQEEARKRIEQRGNPGEV